MLKYIHKYIYALTQIPMVKSNYYIDDTQLPNSEQSYKGKVKIHKYINRQNQSTTENCEHRNDPDLVQAFLKMVG
jgi:hypothetical protein